MSKTKNKKLSDSKIVENRKFYCEGGVEDSGHPKIFLVIGENDDSVSCPYCGKIFTLRSK
tara:strand:+ start:634 stop:813 length:180 start_codon:yes stop_codon:yes gene_type:complete